MLGAKLVFFALDLKLDWATVILVLTSAPKLLWLVVCFDKQFWFWYETDIVPENSYSGIWPFLEILSFILDLQILVKKFSFLFPPPAPLLLNTWSATNKTSSRSKKSMVVVLGIKFHGMWDFEDDMWIGRIHPLPEINVTIDSKAGLIRFLRGKTNVTTC